MADQDVEQKRLDLDREQSNFEREQLQGEAAVKNAEQNRSRWTSPLVIAILTAALAGVGNIVLAFVNGSLQRASDSERARETRELERSKSEALLVLEMIKTADPDKAAENLKFLVEAGLLTDQDQVGRIRTFLDGRKPGQGPSLPPSGGWKDHERAVAEYHVEIERQIAGYTEAIKLNPTSAPPYNNRGLWYAAKQDYDQAIADFTEAIKLDPGLTAAYNNRGRAYAAKQEYDLAIADFTEAITQAPKEVAALLNRGNAYIVKEAYDLAIADFTEAIKLNPTALAFDSRGHAYFNNHAYDQAIVDLTEATKLSPKSAPAYQKLGHAYAAKQDYDQAIANFNEAIRVSPTFAPAFEGRGHVYIAKQDYDQAIANFDEAIRVSHKFAPAFSDRGLAYAIKRDNVHAIADFTEAIKLNPKYAYPVLLLYLTRARSGAPTAAAAELETNARSLKQAGWPYPVVELLLGHATPDATFAAAATPNARCEAQFYIGEWHLLRGDRPAAELALKAAEDTCPKTFKEYELARAELQRLRP